METKPAILAVWDWIRAFRIRSSGLIRKAEEDLAQTQRREGDVKMGQKEISGNTDLEYWSEAATSQGMPDPVRTWKMQGMDALVHNLKRKCSEDLIPSLQKCFCLLTFWHTDSLAS
ncbi:myc target protein 1 isoform X2 [Pan troglodytes]|uniref:myc target protein 1 isoform X2 n=1 Tax=Pan troglodytes TaxID=9598 RepID=UPI0030137712